VGRVTTSDVAHLQVARYRYEERPAAAAAATKQKTVYFAPQTLHFSLCIVQFGLNRK